jgi:hypothetical protein
MVSPVYGANTPEDSVVMRPVQAPSGANKGVHPGSQNTAIYVIRNSPLERLRNA